MNSLQVDTHGDIQLTLPTSVNVHEKAQPNQTEKLPDQGSSDDLSQVDELEIPPDTKFTKVHNAVFDQLIPYLSGNQFAVYMELYRNTLGRGHSGNWFRTREVQKICGIGSDKTVRLAIVALEQMKLIRVDWPQKKEILGGFLSESSRSKRLFQSWEKNQAIKRNLATSVPQ